MNEDHALHTGSIAMGVALVVAQLADGGPVGTGATIGMCMILLGAMGWRSAYKLPCARIVRRKL
ncbi:MAG TPA: hypothetical protein VL326_28675 [Kofleriaceae bacterium]|jgi:hypothetical protein|nr:hypothetical protein [Kofleriaceae bacterium]